MSVGILHEGNGQKLNEVQTLKRTRGLFFRVLMILSSSEERWIMHVHNIVLMVWDPLQGPAIGNVLS